MQRMPGLHCGSRVQGEPVRKTTNNINFQLVARHTLKKKATILKDTCHILLPTAGYLALIYTEGRKKVDTLSPSQSCLGTRARFSTGQV